MCVSVFVYVCGIQNIKLLAYMPHEPKSENGIYICVHLSIYICISGYGVPCINLVSLACMPSKPKCKM